MFFPKSDEVIGEVAAAGCRNQPEEKNVQQIAQFTPPIQNAA
jgi:hypothetical protein